VTMEIEKDVSFTVFSDKKLFVIGT